MVITCKQVKMTSIVISMCTLGLCGFPHMVATSGMIVIVDPRTQGWVQNAN